MHSNNIEGTMPARLVAVCLALLCLSLFVAGCSGPKVSEENIKKIKKEMAEEEVTKILGEGKISNRAGAPPDMKELIWESGGNSITVQFKDGKVNGFSTKITK